MYYNFDPFLQSESDRICSDLLNQMYRQGQITDVLFQQIMQTYQQAKMSILTGIQQTAQQQNVRPSSQMIQAALHQFIGNLLVQYRQAPVGGYGVPAPVMGGAPMFGQPGTVVGGYGSVPMGTSYTNPIYGNNAVYNNPIYPQNQAQPFTGNLGTQSVYGPNIPQVVTSSEQMVTAERYSRPNTRTVDSVHRNSLAQNPTASVYSRMKNTDDQVSYTPASVLATDDISNEQFDGKRLAVKFGPAATADMVIGKFVKPILNFDEFTNKIRRYANVSNNFFMISLKTPVILNAPLKDVTTLIQRMGSVIHNAIVATNSTGTSNAAAIFNRFFVEFTADTHSKAHTALEEFLINEFNAYLKTGSISGFGNVSIKSLSEILELLDPHTTDTALITLQKCPKYFDNLNEVIYKSIFSIFIDTANYKVLLPSSPTDMTTLSKVFKDLTVDQFSIADGYNALLRAISDMNISAAIKKGATALKDKLEEYTVIIVPRIYVATNLSPANFVTGDFADPVISTKYKEPTNIIEEYINIGKELLGITDAVTANECRLYSGRACFKFTYGVDMTGSSILK